MDQIPDWKLIIQIEWTSYYLASNDEKGLYWQDFSSDLWWESMDSLE
jgi:hypothetical protein